VGEEELEVNVELQGQSSISSHFECHCIKGREIKKWQERRRFRDSRSLSQASLVRWRRRRTPSPMPARPVFGERLKELQEAQQEICTCMLVLSCQCMYVYVVVYVER